MHIEKLTDELCEAMEQKFGANYNLQQRFIALTAQVGELGDLILIHDRVKENFKNQDGCIKEATFSVLIDLLCLCRQLNVNFEEESKLALEWFRKSYR